ncbi:MAG TPA: hypothetical protein VFP68_03800 [Burkholderiaceae bacterium]|nr:hypothetical protein [Burkholderiaceae bacterium]
MSRQLLSFTVRRATTEADFRAACRVRVASYGHHLPGMADAWSEPDALDRHPDTVVFVATCKSSGEPVGTVRLASNAHGPTQIERSTPLPDSIAGRPMAEVTRLGVVPGHDDPAVKLGLMKTIYLHSMAHQVRWMVIGARSESLVRQYRRLGFTDLKAGRSVELAHAGGLPHRVLGFDVTAAERNWHALRHPFYDFMVSSYHPDIDIFGGPRSAAAGERRYG